MEFLLVVMAATVVLGPWVLGIVALVRANGALAEARRLVAAASPASAAAAWPGTRAEPPFAAPPAIPPPAPPANPESEPLEARLVAPPPPQDAATVACGSPPGRRAESPGASAGAARPALEERIALAGFTRAGAVAILLGAAYFLKYAVDNAWLGSWGRIAVACLSGVAALFVGEALRARTRSAWVHALQGAGLALLFLAAFGSHALYQLVPAGAAFAAVAAAALLGGALAVRHRAELLLSLSLVGGLVAPVVLATGEDRPLALFGYVLVLAGLALAVSVRLGFRVAPWLAFAGAAVLAAGWYDAYFSVAPPPAVPDPSLPLDAQAGPYFPLGRRAVPLAAALALSALWAIAHAGFRRRAVPRLWADAWLAAALLFATVAPFALVSDRPLLAGLALAGAGLLAAELLPRAGRPLLAVAAEVLAFSLLWVAVGERRSGAEGSWIAAAAVVAGIHLAAVALAWLARAEPPGAARTAAAAVGGLGFAAFAVALTSPEEGVLRAALVGGAAVAELALGAAALRASRAKGSVLLGASLALLAGAVAFLFSGATVTVAWAAMAAVAAALGARDRDRLWIFGACALFAAVVVRLLAVDVPSVERATWRFLSSAGAEGRLEPAFLLNPRALALAAAAAAFLLAARAIAAVPPRAGAGQWVAWRPIAAILAALGWSAVVGLAIGEARELALILPPSPAAGDLGAFGAYRSAVMGAWAEQAGTLSMVTSLVLAAAAALLVGGGFLARDAFHRWLGLGLFGLVAAKLLLSDIWLLSRLQQVAVLLALGVLLLSAAFLYARHGRRIAALLRDEPPRGAGGAALLVLLATLGAGPADALDPSAFRVLRPIEGVEAPGLHAVEADADLLRASRAAPGSLADVRVEGPAGVEVPWTLRVAPDPAAERTVEGVVVDSLVLSDGSVRALVDLGPSPPRHGELRLELDGGEFLRPVRLEVSSDGRTFGLLSEGARVWAVEGDPQARRTSVRHPPSEARYVRVTLLPGSGDAPRVTGARAALGAALPATLRPLDLAPPAARRPGGRETLLDVDLGAPGLPLEAVELDVATAAFVRAVRVSASADGAHWVSAGGGMIWRAPPGDGAARADAPVEGLRVAASTGGRRFVRLGVVDGDSPALAVTGLRVLWRPREVVFRAEAAGAHALLAGGEVAAPAYDLAALLARTGEAPAHARLGPARPNPRFREAEAKVPLSERYRVPLSIGLAVLFGGLALWAVRLLRRGPAEGDGV
jgi:hypothetical protein